MLIDRIAQTICRVDEYYNIKTAIENRKQQERIDQRYRDTVNNMEELVRTLRVAKRRFGFILDEKANSNLHSVAEKLEHAIRGSVANEETVNAAKELLRNTENLVSNQWSKEFGRIANSTLGTLTVITSFDAPRAQPLINDITAAKTWSRDAARIERLANSIDAAQSLVQNLGLNPPITAFLNKMACNKATIADLDAEILTWIRKNGLENRVGLSFSTRPCR